MIGKTISHYEILDKLGEGGMGEVYRAFDQHLQRQVAIKVLPSGTLSDEQARKRFRNEALALSRLNHPGIAAVYDFDSEEGIDFLAMEYVPGTTLSDCLASGPLPEPEVIMVGVQIAAALEEAHENGVLHRDLKPGNIILTPKKQVKVLDFGLAKLFRPASATAVTESLTETQGMTGTLPYMAPEQLLGQPADACSDIWALGVLLYEMAGGVRPFQGETGFELSSAILNQAPPPLPSQVSAELRRLIERCLEKDSGRRYQKASEVRAGLEAIQTGAMAPRVVWRYRLARRRWLSLAVAVVFVLLFGALLGLERLRTGLGGGTPRVQSLAVLPLANLSGDPEQDYFADGTTEELITTLAKISALKVISRTSVMQCKGTKKPLPQIAKELNVEAVIEGSVLREGGRVRVTAQLIQASTDQHLWAESYERDLRSVLALQSEIASDIASKVHAALTPAERGQLAIAKPVNPEAYEAYLKGKFYLNKMTPEGFEKGLAYLNQAVEKDPTNPQPYAGLALGYSFIGHGPAPPPDAFARAKAAARKAEELGGEPLAEMYTALGMIKLCSDWDFAGAEKDLRRAMEINPSLGEAYRDHSWYLFLIGHRDEALAEMKQAQEVEPLTLLFYAERGWQYWWAGQNDKALEEARKSLELDPNFNVGLHVLGSLYAEKGMYAEAIAAHQKLAEVDPDWRWSLVRTYAQAGRKDEARKMLAKVLAEEPKPTGAWAGWFLAEDYAALGEKDEAFRWLEAAFRERQTFLPWMEYNPGYAPLRSDPRFQDLVRRMNLPP